MYLLLFTKKKKPTTGELTYLTFLLSFFLPQGRCTNIGWNPFIFLLFCYQQQHHQQHQSTTTCLHVREGLWVSVLEGVRVRLCVCVCAGGHKSLPRTWRNVETRWKQRLREYRINHNFARPKGRPVKALTFSQSGCVAVRVKIVKSWIVYCGDRRHRSAAAAAMAQMGRTAVKNLEAPRPLKSTLKQTHVHVPVYEVQSSE